METWTRTALRSLVLCGALSLLGAAGGDGPLSGPATAAAQAAQEDEQQVTVGGLLRTGLRVGPGDQGVRDGFQIYDARLRSEGEIGIVFDYFVQAEFDPEADRFRLLDARLRLPIMPELVVDLGQFKAPFSREALQGKGEITFVERSQIVQVIAPGRQVGFQLSGETMDGKLSYAGGVFNGNGRKAENDGDDFLYAVRASYNSVGAAEFYDELVVEVGGSVAFSEDTDVDVGPAPRGFGLERGYRGQRLLMGGDVRLGYKGFFLRGEFLRGEFDPDTRVVVEAEDTSTGARRTVPLRTDGVQGGYLEGGYNFLGAIEAVARFDALDEFIGEKARATLPGGSDLEELSGDFLVFGLNLFPGYQTKIGLQYSLGVGGAKLGPGISDGEFALNAQVDF